ncbi:MAG: TlpA family protein disulfide reductase [Anaerolineales bacterium]|nr:TlpA family protein disulfide reductase [Anaerolineales bacterium]
MTEEQTTTTPAPKRGVRLSTQIIIWVVLMALLVLVGLGLKKAQNPIISIGSEIPNFPLTMFEGYSYQGASEVNISDLQGKVVVINFWASWCKPCEQEAAELEEAWRFYEADGEVVFLGIAWTDTPDNAKSYLERFDITYPNGPDLGSRISSIFNRNLGVPETYFIGRDGVLRSIKIGPFTSVQEIHATINPLLADNYPAGE